MSKQGFTLRAPSKYASGHISTVDTPELQKISGLSFIFFCQMLQGYSTGRLQIFLLTSSLYHQHLDISGGIQVT